MQKNTSNSMADDNNDLSPQTHIVERWQVPAFTSQTDSSASSLEHITVEKLERIRNEAYKEAHKEGYAKGLVKGEQDGMNKLQTALTTVDRLSKQLTQPFEDLEEEVENQISQLAISIAKQIIRREINANSGEVVAVVREALALLPVNSNSVNVHVHPDDYLVLNEVVQFNSRDSKLQITEDVSLQRGDCKVFTEYSSIDASVQTRITAVISEMIGGDRSSDTDSKAKGVEA